MRASELLGSTVVDAAGAEIGTVRDVRVRHLTTGPFRIVGLTIARGRLGAVAHAWGFVDGRASGPWLLAKLLGRAARRARFVAAADVVDWGPGTVTVAKTRDELADARAGGRR